MRSARSTLAAGTIGLRIGFLSMGFASPLLAAVAFAIAAAAVWLAGGRLSRAVSPLADKLGMSQGFAGMLLLGGITSLPEIATAGSAAITGSGALAVSNILGTAAINVVLLVAADIALRGEPLPSALHSPSAILQGVLGMVLLAGVATLATVGDVEIGGSGLGLGTSALFAACVAALWVASRSERRPGWTVADESGDRDGRLDTSETEGAGASVGRLALRTGVAAAVILVAGFVLSQAADALAVASGLGASLFGLVLVGFATSLPELSSIIAAVKLRRFDLAVGDVMGTNIVNVAVFFVIDVALREGLAFGAPTPFEAIAALLALGVIGVFLLGVIARRPGVWLRAAPASWAVAALYAAGLMALYGLDQGTPP